MMAGYSGKEVDRQTIDGSVRGWINHVRYGDTWGLRRHVLWRPLRRPSGPSAR